MYSVNVDSNCIDKVFEEKNIPVCLGPSCSVSEWIDKFLLDDPETCSYESNVEEMELTFSDECHDDFGSLSEAAGYGDPTYVFEYISFENGGPYDTVCSMAVTDSGDGIFDGIFETCDFEPLIEVFQGPCEEEGGLMYTYTFALEQNYSNYFEDVYYGTGGYWFNQTFEGEYLNAPICVTPSCHTEDYFEAGVFRYLDFLFDGTFMGGAQISEHTPIEYTLISDLPLPPTATPTVTQSEAPSTAPGSKKKKSKKSKTSKKKKLKALKKKKSKGSKSM